jgi:hypothetical protein
MRSRLYILPLVLCCLGGAALSQHGQPAQPDKTGDPLLRSFFSDFNLPAADKDADMRLRQAPRDAVALFVRMETAELEERPEIVLDSALRLCALRTAPELQDVASNRVLQHAGNTLVFNSVLRRVKSAAAIQNRCAFNLHLALVAAAWDGAKIDLDQTARSAGLLTRWRIVGPFGHYNNVDFERRWSPETDRFLRPRYPSDPGPASLQDRKAHAGGSADLSTAIAPERFWFRDGAITVPEYLPFSGVFYAAGEVDLAGATRSRIDVLSSGSYEVFVDGKPALLHDVRYASGPTRESGSLVLAAGHHRFLVKFTSDAAPLSVAVHPEFGSPKSNPSSLAQPAQEYAQALISYFRGDLTGVENALRNVALQNTGFAQYLRALFYSSAEDHSSRADAAWKAVAMAQPSALLARLKIAESAIERSQPETARPEVMALLAERPQSETALELAFNLSRRDQVEAPALLGRLLELHPSCARLAEGVKFFSSAAEEDTARRLEQQLASCAPESMQYARLVADSGRHSAAAAYLQQMIMSNPLHRAARRFLIEQLLLDRQLSAAKLQAKQLKDIALNARDYTTLADDPEVAQDSRSHRAEGFASGREFYVPYRRDGMDLVRRSAQRSFSGGPAVILLSDKVLMLRHEGPVSVYVHRITRPINKEGISHYGEVTLPHGADLLELRTIKANGEIIEPELAQQKPTISMPALEPGDAIEEEYVMHYGELDQTPGNATVHTFGSFSAPILHSRLVVLSPPDANIRLLEQAGPPRALVGENNGLVVRIWERDNIAQTIAESSLPAMNLLPTVTVGPPEKTRDLLRDQLIDASRTGLHTIETAAELHLPQNASDADKAKQLYRFVTSKIDSTGPDWAGSTAEDTLAYGQGSRTMALLALSRTVALKAGLLLARRIDQGCGKKRDFSCYTEPLVRFWLPGGEPVDVDAESDDLPFGEIPPSLDAADARFIHLLPPDEKRLEMVALSSRPTTEKSIAEADLTFHETDLLANIQVQLGSARAQEIRSMLRNSGERERQAFFEQLAMRTFPGATGVTGSVTDENDPEQALRLSLHCTVPQFINPQSGAAEINQLAPALGLAALYARTPTRKFPLLVDSLFFESTVFHLHLPAGMDVKALPSDFTERTEFGEYALHFVLLPRQIDIHRDFRIPEQVVAPEKYPAFLAFALRIDQAERERISLETMKGTAGTQSRTDLQPVASKR